MAVRKNSAVNLAITVGTNNGFTIGGTAAIAPAITFADVAVASRTYTVPNVSASCEMILAAGAQTFTGAKTFADTTFLLRNAGDTFSTTLATAATAARTYTIPEAGASCDFLVTAGAQTVTGAKTFGATSLLVRNAGDTASTTISTAATASRTYTIPEAGAAANFVMSEGTQSINGAITFTTNITVPDVPTATGHATSKTYVDNLVSGLKWKTAVVCATTGTLSANYDNGTGGVGATLTSTTNDTLTVDGYGPLALNERVLVKNQTGNEEQNGIYRISQVGETGVSPWILMRTTDADQTSEIDAAAVMVTDGTANHGKAYSQTTDDPAIGTDDILWVEFASATSTHTLIGSATHTDTSVTGSIAAADIIVRNAGNTAWTNFVKGTANYVLQMDGTATGLEWGLVDLTANVTGILPLANGGTGANLTAANGGIVWSDANSMEITAAGTQYNVLLSGGAATPTWSTYTANLTVAQGDIVFGSAANALSTLAKDTNATRYLSNTGVANAPAWAQVNLTNGVTGVLPIANGGTNKSTWTAYSIAYASAANVLGELTIGTANYLLAVNATADGYTWKNPADFASNSFVTIDCPAGTDPVADTASDTLTLTSTGATLTITGNSTTDTVNFDIAATFNGLTWNRVTTGTAGTAVTNNGYLVNTDDAGNVYTLTLPASGPAGEIVEIVGANFGQAGKDWRLAPSGGDTIQMGTIVSDTGTNGGYLTNVNDYGDSVRVVRMTTDGNWMVIASMGNIDIIVP